MDNNWNRDMHRLARFAKMRDGDLLQYDRTQRFLARLSVVGLSVLVAVLLAAGLM